MRVFAWLAMCCGAATLALGGGGREGAGSASAGSPPGAVRVFAEQPSAFLEAYFSAAVVSPDGRRAVYGGVAALPRLLDLDSGRDLTGEPVPGVTGVLAAAFGQDGEWAVLGQGGDRAGWFIAGDSGRPRPVAIPPDATPVWEPAGPRVAFLRATTPDSVVVGPADSIRGYPIQGPATGLAWLPRGAGLLVLALTPSGSSTLWKLELPTRRTAALVDSLDAPWGPPSPFAVAPDGRRVFIALAGPGAPDPEARNLPRAERRLGIYQVDLATGDRRVMVPPPERGDAFAPSTAGENVFWTTTRTSVSIVLLPAAGGPAEEVVDGAFAPTWRPDGRRLGFAYGDWRWVDFPLNWDGGAIEVDERGRPTGPVTPVMGGYHEDFPPVWSPVGGWVAYHSHRSKLPVAL